MLLYFKNQDSYIVCTQGQTFTENDRKLPCFHGWFANIVKKYLLRTAHAWQGELFIVITYPPIQNGCYRLGEACSHVVAAA